MLGMTRAEIKRKFDEIVAFAETEKFLDTPVKRYSSGMYVRLAFAVAAHLEPEILIVDEVLAVGDAQFQQKCIGRMQDVGREGRTVLFVSHNMAAIQSLCSKGMLLSHGRLIGFGNIGDQVQDYLASTQNAGTGQDRQISMRSGIQVKELRIDPNPVVSGRPVAFVMELGCAAPMRLDAITILINTYNRALAGVVDLRGQQAYRFNGEDSLLIRVVIRTMPVV